ncbi:hypothetical protein [Thermaurantiacus sp.]
MTLLRRDQFLAALRAPDRRVRLWFIAGPDAGETAALEVAAREALGAGGTLVELAPEALVEDPGLLAERAALVPLFGGHELLFVRAQAFARPEGLLGAVSSLLSAAVAGNPCLLVAGALSRSSRLRAVVEAHPLARAVIAFAAAAREVADHLRDIAARTGLRLDREAGAALWAAAQGHPLIAEREAEKLALWLDATPDRPKPVPREGLGALLPGEHSAELEALAVAVLGRDPKATAVALAGLGETGSIPAIRTVARRLLGLLPVAEAVEAGTPAARAVAARRPPPSRQDAEVLARAASRWPGADLRAAIHRLIAAEAAVKARGSAGDRIGQAAILDLVLALGAVPRTA